MRNDTQERGRGKLGSVDWHNSIEKKNVTNLSIYVRIAAKIAHKQDWGGWETKRKGKDQSGEQIMEHHGWLVG